MKVHSGSSACIKEQQRRLGKKKHERSVPMSKAAIAARRDVVIALFHAGRTTAQIMAEVGLSRGAVNAIVRDLR